MRYRVSRRDFIRMTALASGALPLSRFGVFSQDGSKMKRTGAPKKVIVVGAGLAGLSAAYELTEAGHDVSVLEAQMRPGGRALTLREPFSDGLYANVGPIHFPDTHNFTVKYAKLFNVPLEPETWNPDLASIHQIRGKRILMRNGLDTSDWPDSFTPEEKKLGFWGMLERYLKPGLDEMAVNPAAPDWHVGSLKKYDEMSYVDFLRAQGASSGAIILLTIGWWGLWGDGPATVSALAVLRDKAHEFEGNEWYRIKGGNDLLPKAIAQGLSDKIRYGAPVVRIEQNDEGVRVVFLQSGTHHTLEANYLICAIPFSVLRGLEISPSFSPGKQKAIDELPYFSVARVSMQCRKRFWVEQGLHGSASTDLPIQTISHVTAYQPGPRGILQSYTGGPDARRLMELSESERIRFTLEQMEKVFPEIRENFEGGVSKLWDEDPWARGASSWYRPGQMTELWPHIARVEGRIHFAGDHTSAWIRWMQGALESGNRVAREVNEAV